MPIDESELDRVIEPQWRTILDSMEEGKFYSMDEMSEKLVKKKIFDNKHAIKQYLPVRQDQRFVNNETVLSAI